MTDVPAGLRILIVEDESVIAMLIEDMLTDLGHAVVAVASRLSDALEQARTGTFDLAIVDVNLHGQPSYAVADLLSERGIRFAFATGYGTAGLESKHADAPTLTKPFTIVDLQNLLSRLQQGSARADR